MSVITSIRKIGADIMGRIVKDRGASGHGSIVFRQDLSYPREPEQITYYPPEPSEELRKQVAKDKAGGIGLYFIGFAIGIIAFMVALGYSTQMEIYATLIPFLLILGLVFALLYLILNNVTLAKLSRAMPLILLVALLLLYIFSILSGVLDLANLQAPDDNASQAEHDAFQDNMSDRMEYLISSILNPAFFLLLAGLIIARAGGTMLWTSTKVVHDYIPATIILEVPGLTPAGDEYEEPEKSEEEELPACATCGEPLTYLEQYERWYCYGCNEYAPKEED